MFHSASSIAAPPTITFFSPLEGNKLARSCPCFTVASPTNGSKGRVPLELCCQCQGHRMQAKKQRDSSHLSTPAHHQGRCGPAVGRLDPAAAQSPVLRCLWKGMRMHARARLAGVTCLDGFILSRHCLCLLALTHPARLEHCPHELPPSDAQTQQQKFPATRPASCPPLAKAQLC